ncbi:MAG: hypothetical protein JKX98_11255 [Alcanivoracaceae bacterium]|nr:hypothetical protein [Alcanivoracaceae bacterium]
MKKFSPIKTTCQWFASVDEGKQLEIVEVDNDGKLISDSADPLMSFFKNDSDELHLEFNTDKGVIQIPTKNILEAIALAEKDCNSEKWYEDNVYPKIDSYEDKL